MNKAVIFALFTLLVINSVNCDSWVRFVHGVANGPNVDIFVDNERVLTNVPYGAFSQYLSINDGNNVDFEVRSTGANDALVSDTIDINNNEYYTIVVGGLLSNTQDFPLRLLDYTDSDSQPSNGQSRVRFIHASAGSPDVDFIIDNDVIAEDVSYPNEGSPEYSSIDSGSSSIQVNLEGTSTVVVGPATFNFNEESVYTVFAIGIPSDVTSPLSALIIEDFVLFSDSNNNNADDNDNNADDNDNSSASAIFVSALAIFAAVAAML